MTKKFGIIGNPIQHSLSPVLHNYWFKKYKIDASYSLIEVKDNDLTTVIKKIKNKELSGINITLPYKQKIVPHVDVLVNDAEITSSVNTVYINDQETIIGENTDVYGLQAAYLKQIDKTIVRKALVIGAGGVSPSVILSLQKSGISEISISNRTKEKCLFLKKKFKNLNIIEWKSLKDKLKDFDIIVNATSLGLKEDENIDLDYSKIGSEKFFYDVIYNPSETNFLRSAKKNGNKIENGKRMFIYQAQASFKIWNNLEPKVDNKVMELLN